MNPEDEQDKQDQQKGEPAGSPSVSSMDPDEYNRRFMESVRARQEQEPEDPEKDAQKQKEEGWFHKLIHGPEGQSIGERAFEVASSAGRGAVKGLGNMANSLTTELGELGDRVENPLGTSEDHKAAGKKRAESNTTTINKVATAAFGEQTEDPLANLVEGISQFAIPFVLTGKVGGAAGEGASLGEVGHAFAKAGGLAGWAKATGLAAARGAITDATAFDPYEAQLAEWAATSKWAPLAKLGEALSVGKADDATVAHWKRAAAGMVPGVIMDAFFGGVKLLTSLRKAADKSLPAAERAAAATAAEDAAKQVEAAQNGTRVPGPTEHVVAKVNPDGTATLGLNPNSGQRGTIRQRIANVLDPERRVLAADNARLRREAETDAMTGLGNKQAFERARATVDADPNQHWVFFDLNNFKALNDAFGQSLGDDVIKTFANVLKKNTARGFRIGGDEFMAATDNPDALRDAVEAAFGFERDGIRSNASGEIFGTSDEALSEEGKNLLKTRKNARKSELGMALTREDSEKQAAEAVAKRAQEPETLPDAPVYASKQEAEEAAATANGAIEDVVHDGQLTDEGQVELANRAAEIAKASTPADAAKMVDGTFFNFHYYTDTDENVRGLIEAVGEKFKAAFEAVQNRPQGVSVDEFIARTLAILNGMTEADAPAILTGLLKQGEGRSYHALAADVVHKAVGKQLADMADMLRTRPDDVALHEQFRNKFALWYRLSKQLASANTDWGLQGRMSQERANASLRSGLKFAKQTVKKAESDAKDIKKELADAKKELAAAEKEVKKAAKKAPKDKAKIGPNTETVADIHDIEANRAGKGAGDAAKEPDVEDIGLGDSEDTIGPNANDFILERARRRAAAAQKRVTKFYEDHGISIDGESEVGLDNASLRGERTKMQADAQRANPIEAPEVPTDKKPGTRSNNPIKELSFLIEKAEKDLDNGLEKVRNNVGKQQGPKEMDPVSQFKRDAKQLERDADKAAKKAAKEADEDAARIAGMDRKKIREVARVMEMAQGDPNGVFAVKRATETIWREGWGAKALEVFTNFLLSGPKTVLTALGSGTATTVFEPAMRILGGAMHGDRQLMQRGARLMWGNAVYFKENLRTLGVALKRGRSVINPMNQTKAIHGLTGEIVRVPGRLLVGADEFVRVTNYRSYVRMKSMEFWEGRGLNGKALRDAVEQDVKNSFDEATGEALIPEAMKYAERPTFSGPLEYGIGKGFHEFTNNHLEAKFIAPFVKASVHLFRYAHEMTPLLNRASKLARDVREAAMAPGASVEARQALQTLRAKEAVATSIYVATAYAFHEGSITGRAPSDPKMREVWLQTHQPYSVKVGDHWVSYRRADPFATIMGIMADALTMGSEMEDDDVDLNEMLYSTIASMMSNFSSKTYMSGLAQFTSAITSGRSYETERWLQGIVSSAAVPNLVASFNPDGTYREVQGMLDAIAARVPGWSETLMARYDPFGEPMMKQPGTLNRAVNPLGTRPTKDDIVADKLLAIRYGWKAPAIKIGDIDLSDKKWDTKGVGMRPYERWMQLVTHPKFGPSLYDALKKEISSPFFENYSPGTAKYPGGTQEDRIKGIVERYYLRAQRQMLQEYPELDKAITEQTRIIGAARRGGEPAVKMVEEMFQ
jgi:FOG: GGDEF domain